MELHPAIRQEVIDTIIDLETNKFPPNVSVRIVQGLRTIEVQNALYAMGRTAPGKVVTMAQGGRSYHNYGLAIDFALLYDGKLSWDLIKDFDHDNIDDWNEVVNAFLTKGFSWGGTWRSLKDYPHLEKSFGLTWSQCLVKYEKKDFIAGTNYINI